MSIREDWAEYVRSAKNDEDKMSLSKEFFITKSKALAKQAKAMSDDELDKIAGGALSTAAANLQEVFNLCMSLFGDESFCKSIIESGKAME